LTISGWEVTVVPETIEMTGSGTQTFIVTVSVPKGIEDGHVEQVRVEASCQIPIVYPILASDTCEIAVKNTSPDPKWTVRILEPAPGEVFTTDVLAISGTASFNLGNVTSVEVKVCTGIWMVATGTTEWSIDYDCEYLDDGEHTIYARARSGDDYTSPTTEIKVIQDRSGDGRDDGDGNAVPDDMGQERRDLYVYVLIGVLIVGGVGIGYWYYSRRQRDELAYLTNYY
jgi:hypothetical protein